MISNNCLRNTRRLWDEIDRMERSERSVSLMPFTNIVVDGAVDLVFAPCVENRLVVASSSMGTAERVMTRMSDGVLYIDGPNDGDIVGARMAQRSIWSSALAFLRAMFGFASVDQSCKAPCKIVVGLSQEYAPNIIHKGVGKVSLSQLHQSDIDLEAAGAVTFEADGVVQDLQLVISGTGAFECKDLSTSKASLMIDGTGSIKVEALERVRSHISGTGSITVSGQPAMKAKTISGTGQVRYI